MRFYCLVFLMFIVGDNVFAQSTFPVNGNINPNHNYIAFTHANIVTEPGKLISGVTMLIKDDKIEAIGADVDLPESAIVYDLKGAYIYHSFIDPYSNYGMPPIIATKSSQSPQIDRIKKGAYDWNDAIKAEKQAYEEFSIDKTKAKILRSQGFGLVVSHQMDGIMRGTAALVNLSDKLENKALKTAEVYTAYSFNKGSSKQRYPTSLMGIIALLRQTLYDANWYATAKNRQEYNITLDQINRTKDLPRLIDVEGCLSALRANKIADEFGFKFIIKGGGDEYRRLDEIKATQSSFILPLYFPSAYDVENPYDAMNVSLAEMKHWEMAPFEAQLFEKNSIEFAFTANGLKKPTDFLPNWRKTIQAGLSKEKALAAITTEAAKILNLTYTDGKLKEGGFADFIICSLPIFNPKSVIYDNWIAGQRYIIHNRNRIDIRGTYSVNINSEKHFDLIVKGEKDKLKAIIEKDGIRIPSTIKLEENQLTLIYKNTATDDSSFIRMTAHINDNESRIWSGIAILKDGNSVKWSAIKKKEYKEPIKKDSVIKMTHGAIWYPNMAFGFEEKPIAKNYLFRNATVWTNGLDGILKETDVLVVDGKIYKIGPNLNLDFIFPKKKIKIEEINAEGKYLSPGIVDEHSHIAISRGVNESGQAISSEVAIGDVINSDDINIYRQLAGGVVVSQLLHGSANPIGGKSAIIKLKWGDAADDMKIDSAAAFIKFALGENVKQSNWGDNYTKRFPQSRMGVEQLYYDEFYRAMAYQDEWKLYNAKSKKEKKEDPAPRKDLELETLVEILNGKRNITCHSYEQSEMNMLLHVADSMGFKINTFTHGLEAYKIADKIKAHGTAVSTFSDWWAYKFEVNDAIPYNGAINSKMGVLTGFNSDDAEMGRRLNQEAAKAIKYGGLSEQDAFKFVTYNPAKMLHLENRMGSIVPGKEADIVLWSADPLSIYTKVEKTIIDGVCYYDSKRDKELHKRDLAERERLIQKMIVAKRNGEKTQKVKKENKELYKCETINDEGSE